MPTMGRKKRPPPIDGGWAWVVAFGVFMNLFFLMGITKSCGMFMVEFIREFKISTAYSGTTITVASLVFAIGSSIAGAVGESVTHRKLVIFGGFVGMLGYAMSGMLISMPYVIVCFSIGYGVGNCCSYGSNLVMLSKYFRKKRSTATGIALSGTSVGQFAMPPIIEFLLETYGLGGTLWVIGALYFHCSLSGALYRPIEHYDTELIEDVLQPEDEEAADNHKESKSNLSDNCNSQAHEMEKLCPNDNDDDNNIGEGVKPSNKLSVDNDSNHHLKVYSNSTTNLSPGSAVGRLQLAQEKGLTYSCNSLIYDPTLIASSPDKDDNHSIGDDHQGSPSRKSKCLAKSKRIIDFSILRNYVVLHFIFLIFCGYLGLYNFIIYTPAIVESRGMTKYDKALLLSLCGIGDLIARVSVGFFADRNYIQRYKIKALTGVLCGSVIGLFIFAESFLWMAVLNFLVGLFAGVYVCVLPVVMLDFLDLEKLSKALGMVILSQGIAGAVGQMVFGTLVDSLGSYSLPLALMALAMILSGILLMFTPLVWRFEQKRHSQANKEQTNMD